MPKKIMYSFKIEKELIDKARKEAKKVSMSTSTFIRQAIIEKLDCEDRLYRIEKRIEKLESLIKEK